MVNRIPAELLEQGLDYAAFRARIDANAEVFDEVYKSPAYREEDFVTLGRLPALTVVAIGEGWCPDVFHTLPTWARAVERLPGWSVRAFFRDEHPELMDGFLYRSRARRIPVYAFLDEASLDGGGTVQAWWSGRCREAQEAIDAHMAGRSFADLSPEEKAAAGEFLDRGYQESFRRKNFEEILTLLRAFFHVD